jgi:hypothetical protein
VLEEIKRWSAMPYEQVLLEVPEVKDYQVEFQGKQYDVEVQILENTNDYIHVGVGVDDGSLPASFRPLSDSFIRQKDSLATNG